VNSVAAHDERIFAVAISPDGAMAASGSTDNTIKFWDLKSAKCLSTLRGHRRAVWALAFSPDGETLASGSGDQSVRLWNVSRRQEVGILRNLSTGGGSSTFSVGDFVDLPSSPAG
jgi:WD40 repeat protein